MPEFPATSVPPAELLEGFVPRAFTRLPLPEGARGMDTRVGLKLVGRGGGEWVLRLAREGVQVESVARDAAPFSVIQSVKDWRGALWERRGAALGRVLALAYGAGNRPSTTPALPSLDLSVVDKLAGLDAMVRLLITEGKGGDWRLDLRLGPGAIPAEPQVTLQVTAEDADALAARDLDPLPALVSGRIQVGGDMALLLQIQGLVMQARG